MKIIWIIEKKQKIQEWKTYNGIHTGTDVISWSSIMVMGMSSEAVILTGTFEASVEISNIDTSLGLSGSVSSCNDNNIQYYLFVHNYEFQLGNHHEDWL